MGCQCTKSNLPTDKNEIIKDSSAQTNMSNVIKSKLLSSSNSNKQFFESIKHEGVQFQDDATSNNNRGSSTNTRQVIANYNGKIVALLNNIRSNPSGYAKTVEDSIKNIQISSDNKLIYKAKVKVTLAQGEPAFKDAIAKLRMMNKMEPLLFKQNIVIPLPGAKEQLNDINYFKDKVKEVQQRAHIDIYFRDLVKHPETSALLMIVDDIKRNPGKKRNAILNPAYKYIGVSSTVIDNSFMAYFAFSK